MTLSQSQSAKEITKGKTISLNLKCPFCNEDVLITIHNAEKYSRKNHITLHGKPIHAIIVFVNEHFRVSCAGYVESIEVISTSDTYMELTRLFSNNRRQVALE